MYDSREKVVRDRQWLLAASLRDSELKGEIRGEIKGEVRLIHTLEDILGVALSDDTELAAKSLEELQALAERLRSQVRSRST